MRKSCCEWFCLDSLLSNVRLLSFSFLMFRANSTGRYLGTGVQRW